MTARRGQLGYVLKRFPRISETFVAAELIELERQRRLDETKGVPDVAPLIADSRPTGRPELAAC